MDNKIKGSALFIKLMEELNAGVQALYLRCNATEYRLKRDGEIVFIDSHEMMTNSFGHARMTREQACRFIKSTIKNNEMYTQNISGGGFGPVCDPNKKS